jgi:hypothetical protein
MRLNTIAVATLASLPASLAFAPSVNGPVARNPITMNMAKSDNDFTATIDQAKNGMLSVFAASMIFLGPGAMVEPAHAASPTVPAQVVKTTAAPAPTKAAPAPTKAAPAPAKTAEKPKPVDPLAAEKTNVEAAKGKLSSATSAESKAKKILADANSAFKKAEDATTSAEKKVVERKKALISSNDKLADAKAKEGMSGGSASSLKEVETLASKVGMCFSFHRTSNQSTTRGA